MAGAIAQVSAQAQQIVRALPPNMFPPLIIQYNAASVPVLMASLSSDELPEQELNDLGNSFIRTQLVTIPGAAVPVPYGGKSRVVNVDLDPDGLYARGLSPQDVTSAILSQNVILPAGTAKMGAREYDVAMNGSPEVLDDLNRVPIRYVNGAMVYVGDVALRPRRLQSPDEPRAARRPPLRPVARAQQRQRLDALGSGRGAPDDAEDPGRPAVKSLKVDFLFDQSVFVRAAVSGVLHEGAIAAGLTGMMILLFLRSWRSTLIVAMSIPLSILVSIMVLDIQGQTLNVMTLGVWPWPSASSSTTRRSRSRTRTATWTSASRCGRPFSTPRRRSRCPRSSRPSRSASCSCRSCSSAAWAVRCSRRWP